MSQTAVYARDVAAVVTAADETASCVPCSFTSVELPVMLYAPYMVAPKMRPL